MELVIISAFALVIVTPVTIAYIVGKNRVQRVKSFEMEEK